MNSALKKDENILVHRKDNYLLQMENYHEVFFLGNKFQSDFESGVFLFGFSSLGHDMGQKRTILGLACYFDYNSLGRVAIVSDSFDNDIFSQVNSYSSRRSIDFLGNVSVLVNRFGENLDLVKISHLPDFKQLRKGELIQSLKLHYDIVFCDLPSWDTLKNQSHNYLSLVMSLESLSVIVAPSVTKNDDIEMASKFFSNYGINFSGFIIDKHKS